MINCQQAREYMNLQLDEVLDESINDQLKEHLHQCNDCLDYKTKLETLHVQLRNMPDVHLEESIVDRLIANEQFSKSKSDKSLNKLSNIPFKKKMLPWYGVAVAAIIAISFIPSVLLPNSENDIADQELAERKPAEVQLAQPRIAKSPEISQNDQSEQNSPQMSIMKAADTVNPVQIEVKENQLIITKEQKEIFHTNKWSNDLTVQWEIVDENTINYFLYNKSGEQVESFRINLITQQEEKLSN